MTRRNKIVLSMKLQEIKERVIKGFVNLYNDLRWAKWYYTTKRGMSK